MKRLHFNRGKVHDLFPVGAVFEWFVVGLCFVALATGTDVAVPYEAAAGGRLLDSRTAGGTTGESPFGGGLRGRVAFEGSTADASCWSIVLEVL